LISSGDHQIWRRTNSRILSRFKQVFLVIIESPLIKHPPPLSISSLECLLSCLFGLI
jgi:hypothetical protein